MFILIFTIFSFCAEALMLPPGFVVRQFGHTRDKLSTAKIEQKVVYGDNAFKETLWFKSPDKIRAVVSKDNDTVTLVRNGNRCAVASSSKRMEIECAPITTLFYYNLLLSNNDAMIAYIKYMKINPRDAVVSVKQAEEGSYIKPEGIVLVNYNKKPMYIIGVSDSLYKSSVDLVLGKNDLNTELVNDLKYKTSQLWMDKSNFWPLRVYNGSDTDIILSNYITDGNEVPFPKAISIMNNDKNVLSYGVSIFETGVEIKDDMFAIDALKRLPLSKAEELSDNKNKMLEYLREYR